MKLHTPNEVEVMAGHNPKRETKRGELNQSSVLGLLPTSPAAAFAAPTSFGLQAVAID